MERSRTQSKIWFDDEIKYKDVTTGEIHLHDGVKRMSYNDDVDVYGLESHLNDVEYRTRKKQERLRELNDGEFDEI